MLTARQREVAALVGEGLTNREIAARLGIDELATCSALTASASRMQHFNALSQLDKILGVRCFGSVADFVDWLQSGAELDLPRHSLGFAPRIGGSEAAALQDGDRSIVAHLFRDSTEVDLDPLHGGYSEATVWRAVSRDALGQQQRRRGVPAVAQPDRAHSRLAQEGLPGAPVGLALDRPSVGLGEDQLVVLPERASGDAFLELGGPVSP